MLIIALFGRRFMKKLGWFTRHAEAVRRGFGVLILLSVAYIASGADLAGLLASRRDRSESPVVATSGVLTLSAGLEKPYPAPEFAGIDTWLNSPPLTMHSLKGKVVLVDFWTYSCINCVRTLPYITEWDRKYRDQGLVIIGVHAPEFEFEKRLDNVKAALVQHQIRYPVAIDNQLATWGKFNNEYWPAHYLIDRNGQVVYTHFGEGDYDVTENNIRYLLGLKTSSVGQAVQNNADDDAQTPETYLGYARADRYSGAAAVVHDQPAHYRFAAQLAQDHWTLDGRWRAGTEQLTALKGGAALRLHFSARKVFLVMGSADGKPIRVMLRLNGAAPGGSAGKDAPEGGVTVRRNTLYELIDQKAAKNGVLEIRPQASGLQVYAFTFG
jgi:thiol-disulfide isomerase/thioredoxin